MTITPLKTLIYNTTNIPDDTTPTWNAEAGYFAETTRQLNNKLYRNYATVEPLADYYYDDTDPLVPHRTYRIVDNVVMDSTSVPCIQNDTVVYVKGTANDEITNAYYIYNSTDANVNFETVNIASPSNFTLITDYRHEIYNPETTPLIWEDLGYTNKYKQLDQSLGSQTIVGGDMEMSFITSKVDSVFLFNIYGTDINIVVTQIDTSTELYNETYSLSAKNSGSRFWGYFFNDFSFISKISSEIPINFNVRIDIAITNFGGVSKCGLVGIGKSENLGATLYGAGISMIDFSKKEVNTNGETYLKQGNYKSTNNLTLNVETGRVDSVINTLNNYRSVPVVFNGADGIESTYIFGIYNKYDMIVSLPTISKMSIDLESLI